MSARRKTIAVCGGGDVDASVERLAEEVGRRIVEAGCVLACGGLGGVMAAAARGGAAARAAGAQGLVVGLLPGEDADAANPHCEVVIPTGIGVARNVVLVRAADAVVLVGGGSGTLSEAALAWQLGRPLVALEPSGGWAARLAGSAVDERPRAAVQAAATPAEAVALALAAMG